MEYRKGWEIKDEWFIGFMMAIAHKAQSEELRRMGTDGKINKEQLNEVLATRFGFTGNDWQTDICGNDTVKDMVIVDADMFNATVGRWWEDVKTASERKVPLSVKEGMNP